MSPTTHHPMFDFKFPSLSRSSNKSSPLKSMTQIASSSVSLKTHMSRRSRFRITCASTMRRFSVPAVLRSSASWTSARGSSTDDSDEASPYANPSSDTEEHAYDHVMSESSQIATEYRQTQSLKDLPQHHHSAFPLSFDPPSPVSSPSFVPSEMQGHASESYSSSSDADSVLSIPAQVAHLLHERLCDVTSPIIIDNYAEVVNDDGNGLSSQSYYEHPRDTTHYSSPESPPTIVVTAPPEGDVFSPVEDSRYTSVVDLFWPRRYLFAPPIYRSKNRMHTYEELLKDSALFFPVFPHPPGAVNSPVSWTLDPPTPEFNRDRLYDLVVQDEKHCAPYAHMIAFNDAACEAIAFRRPYNNPLYLEYVEACLIGEGEEWVEPGVPYLADLRENSPTAHIFESPQPLVAPHIIVHPAPAEDPGIAWSNTLPVQDCGEGETLIVIPCNLIIHYVNRPAWNPDFEPVIAEMSRVTYSLWRPWDQWDEWVIVHDMDDDFEDYKSSGGYLSEVCSAPDSPGPQTPLHRHGNIDFLSNNDSHDDLCSAHDTPLKSISYIGVSPSVPSKSKFYIEDEDEDDGPPPFDEWFQQIAERNQLSVSVS